MSRSVASDVAVLQSGTFGELGHNPDQIMKPDVAV